MKYKDSSIAQRCRAVLDPPDGHVAILYGKGKVARHEGGAHSLEFAAGHLSAPYQGLRSAADCAIKGPDTYFLSCSRSNGFLTNLDLTRSAIPKGRGNISALASSHF